MPESLQQRHARRWGSVAAVVIAASGFVLASTAAALFVGMARDIGLRLLSPLPVWWVPLEKVLFAAIRGTIASSVIFPLAWWILGAGFSVRTDRIGTLIGMVILTAIVGSTIGLLMGTVIKPEQISLMFTLIFTCIFIDLFIAFYIMIPTRIWHNSQHQ